MPGAGGISGAEYGSDAYTNAMRMMAMGQILQGGNGGSYFNYMQQMHQAKQADAQRAAAAMAASEAEAQQQAMMQQAQGMLAQYIGAQTPNPVQPFNNNRADGASVAADAMAYVKPELFPGLSQDTINMAARTNAPAASALIKMFYDMPDDLGQRTRAGYEDGQATFAYNDQEARDYAREAAPDYGYGFADDNPNARFGAQQSMPTPIAPERMAQIMMNPMVPKEIKEQVMARFQQAEPKMQWIDGVGMVDMNNPPPDLMAGQYEDQGDREIRNDQNGVARYVDTGEPVFPNIPQAEAGPDFDTEQKLRKEFESNPTVKDYYAVRDSWGRIQGAAQDPSAAGDLALIFNFMKMLDPASVVRESEFATAQNAAGVPEQIRNTWNRLKRGERLAPEQRGDFLNRAGALFNSQTEGYNFEVDRFRTYAEEYGLDADRIASPRDRYNPVASSAPESFSARNDVAALAAAKGVTIQELWESMPEEERAKWSN